MKFLVVALFVLAVVAVSSVSADFSVQPSIEQTLPFDEDDFIITGSDLSLLYFSSGQVVVEVVNPTTNAVLATWTASPHAEQEDSTMVVLRLDGGNTFTSAHAGMVLRIKSATILDVGATARRRLAQPVTATTVTAGPGHEQFATVWTPSGDIMIGNMLSGKALLTLAQLRPASACSANTHH